MLTISENSTSLHLDSAPLGPQRLKGKKAVITGGSAGIGARTAELFAQQGAQILCGDINQEAGLELQKRYPDLIKFQYCDVTKEGDIKKLMEVAKTHFGCIDIMINNAGATGTHATIKNIEGSEWSSTLNLLLQSTVLGMRYAIPHMKSGGSIINMSSIAGLQAINAPLAYSVAKAAILHLTKITAADLGRDNIRVNAICPGFILTNIYNDTIKAAGIPDSMVQKVKDQMAKNAPNVQPIPKAGTTEDVAQTCLFLASDESSFITGAHIIVDGGFTTGIKDRWDPDAQKKNILVPQTQDRSKISKL